MLKRIYSKLNLSKRYEIYKKEKSIKSAHHNHRKQFLDDYKDIDNIIEGFRAGGGLKHDFQSYKLWELKKYLRLNSPESILEFGSGSSSSIFAKYSFQNKVPYTSYDESKHWIDNTKNILNNNLNDNIRFVHADRTFNFDEEITTVNYNIDIDGFFDFVLIDGPSLRINNIRRKDAVNADILKLSDLPKIILIDGRKSTFEYLVKKLGSKYKAFPSNLFTKTLLKSGYDYFSRLELIE